MGVVLAIVMEVVDLVLGYLAAGGWWQIPVSFAAWKVGEAITSPVPQDPAEQSPVQAIAGAVGNVAGAAGQTAGAAGATARSFGDLMRENGPLILVGGAALFILTRR